MGWTAWAVGGWGLGKKAEGIMAAFILPYSCGQEVGVRGHAGEASTMTVSTSAEGGVEGVGGITTGSGAL